MIGVALFSTTSMTGPSKRVFADPDKRSIEDRVTDWLRSKGNKRILRTVILQSSDVRYHCFTITFVWESA